MKDKKPRNRKFAQADIETHLQKVDKADRERVEDILWGVLNYSEEVPRVSVEIDVLPECYNIQLYGWCMPIDFYRFTQKYLNPERRASTYSPIVYATTTRTDDSTRQLILLVVQRSRSARKAQPPEKSGLRGQFDMDLINVENVDPVDRAKVKSIIYGILTMDEIVPKVQIEIDATPECYNVSFHGWEFPINFAEFSEKFLDPEKRANIYASVISAHSTRTDDDKKHIVLVAINRSSFTSDKRKK